MSDAREKSCMSFSSAETVSNNVDLLSEILVRVPAKSLLKFKCVSKLWLSLVSDPKFCFCHARLQKIRDPMPSALLLNRFCPTTRSIRKFHRVPLKSDRDAVLTKIPNLNYLNVRVFKIMQSCNGLLLCSSYYEKKDDCKRNFFVCNPTTKQFKALSFPFDGNANGLFLNLAFDPLRSPHYKVPSVHVQDFKVDRYLIDSYSSENDSWNSLETPFLKIPYGIELDSGVFCNGSIHWYGCEKNSLYFDLDCESLKILPMPSMVLRGERSIYDVLYFGESRGHLHMVVAQKGSVLEFEVLQLNPDYSGWFLRYHVDLHAVRAASPHLTWSLCCRQFSVLSFVDAEKEEESLFVIFVYGKAISYNFFDGMIIEICDLWQIPKIITDARVYKTWLGRKYYEGRDAYDYYESLICL